MEGKQKNGAIRRFSIMSTAGLGTSLLGSVALLGLAFFAWWPQAGEAVPHTLRLLPGQVLDATARGPENTPTAKVGGGRWKQKVRTHPPAIPGSALQRYALAMPQQSDAQRANDPWLHALDVLPSLMRIERPLLEAAQRHDIDPELMMAMIAIESRFQSRAVSARGAVGLMQVVPATARRFGVRGGDKKDMVQLLEDAQTNIEAGTGYLRYLVDLFDGDLELALAGYNAGEGAVRRAGRKIPNYPETQNYVRKVMYIYRQRSERGSHYSTYQERMQGVLPLVRDNRVLAAAIAAASPAYGPPSCADSRAPMDVAGRHFADMADEAQTAASRRTAPSAASL